MNRIWIFLFLLSILFFGCGEESTEDIIHPPDEILAPSSDGLLPLRIGNEWVYQRATTQGDIKLIRWTVADTSRINTVLTFEMNYFEDGELQPWARHYLNHGNGLYVHGAVDQNGDAVDIEEPRLFLPYPISETGSFPCWSAERANFRGANKNIGVPAGSFLCHKYELYFDIETNHMCSSFWSPHVGMIAQFEYIEGELIRKWELTSYKR
ncbi:MAG: hypothetical protein B6244_04375 [Candidatus Cloacimonetes bacterium 4572_55]|nr:MAG: hypothetical protein B6244_04375 [Candidatus Cloacimonetes bacterium 4572_55]